MPGREPEKKANPYFSPKVTWLLVILVGVSVMVVGLIIFSDQKSGGIFEEEPVKIDTTQVSSDTARELQDIPEQFARPDSVPFRSYTRGIEELDGTGRFGLIFFRSDQCPPCDSMEFEILTDPIIKTHYESFIIPIKIEADSKRKIEYMGRRITESRLVDFFNIPGYPALLFYDGLEQNFLFQLSGIQSPARLAGIVEYLELRGFEDPDISPDSFLYGPADTQE